MSIAAQRGHELPVLRNWILGFVATTLWTMNYVVYFARDIRAWYRRPRRHRRQHAAWHLPEHRVTGPLPADEMQPFPPPPPPPPPVRDAEIVTPGIVRPGRQK
jgi:hypothetical protein